MKAHDMDGHRKVLVGITGASGSLYAIRLLKLLSEAGVDIDVIATEAGIRTLGMEVPREVLSEELRRVSRFYENGDIAAPPASGTFHYDAHVIVPCSMNTIGRIHSGICDSLLLRSCSVALKERRRLVLVPRESPVSSISLQQMADLSRLGCDICMASPGFYAKPRSIEDLVDFICLRVMALIGIGREGLRHVAANYLNTLATEERNGVDR